MTAANPENLEPEVIEAEVDEVEAPEVPEGGETEQQADVQDEEFDIVLEGDEEPAPQKGKIPKRVKKLLDKNNVLQTDATANAQEIVRLQTELAASRQPAAQATGIDMPLPPTEESTDYDPEKLRVANAEYQTNLRNWFSNQQQTANKDAEQRQMQADASARESTALEAHYERADGLNVPDYEENEASAVDILGKSLVKSLAMTLTNSAMVINYLGNSRNKALAQEIARLDKADPQAGVAKLWELNFRLKKSPRKNSNAPDPETSVEGSGKESASGLQKQYNKATDAGDIKGRKALRKQAKEQGITLQD